MESLGDPRALEELLCQLVTWKSHTGSAGEARFPFHLGVLLRKLPTFAARGELVTPAADADSAQFVTALHLAEGTADTIILISHYDTVDTAEYGQLEALAHHPHELSGALVDHLDERTDTEAALDARSGDYLFGRGTVDMKAGLALHIGLIERAHAEQWPINLLLLTVSDEEVASAGMRAAIHRLVELRERHGLRYVLALNSEPSFPTHPGDEHQYVHTGSIGKLLPSAICVGRETHAGTPLAGLSSTFIASYLTREMEWCSDFREETYGEATPPPVTLWQRDLRSGYSTQTTSRTATFHNVFVMRRTAGEVLGTFASVARRAAEACTADYHAMCARAGSDPIGDISVMRFEELLAHANDKLGSDTTERLLANALNAQPDEDLCVRSMHAADALIVACPELAPAIVVMFAPPYYPPVDSFEDPLVRACVTRICEQASTRFAREMSHQHWFSAISDLSYAAHSDADTNDNGWRAYERNTPGYGDAYAIPFAAMRQLDMPVLNVGPLGKDLHMRTERLNKVSAFEELPALLADLVEFVAGECSR